jgi:hypothetical protein
MSQLYDADCVSVSFLFRRDLRGVLKHDSADSGLADECRRVESNVMGMYFDQQALFISINVNTATNDMQEEKCAATSLQKPLYFIKERVVEYIEFCTYLF